MTDHEHSIVTIGGGTGTFVVLSGLKRLPNTVLSAIVSVADDGGSTGRFRDAYGFLPMGDARRALVALSNGEDPLLMRSLFEYRFAKGDVAGHNFGNLFLTALTDMLGSPAAAIKAASKILRVKGNVVPVSETPATLVAELKNGEVVIGEHNIDQEIVGRSPIASIRNETPVVASEQTKAVIRDAEVIIMGPGDLYSSILANLVVDGVREAVTSSKARLVYIVNLFTRAGQTEGYTAAEHVAEIERYVGRRPETILVHSGAFPEEALRRYESAHEYPVVDDLPKNDASVVRGSFADAVLVEKSSGDTVPRSLIRHNSERVAAAIKVLLPKA